MGTLTVEGGNLHEAADVLDVGNSGTGIRLLAGLCAGLPFRSVLQGDASIAQRPMDRVTVPLRLMGARIDGRDGGRLAPLVIDGGGLHGIDYTPPVASAQVKSAVLLAGLLTPTGRPSCANASPPVGTPRRCCAIAASARHRAGR